MRGTIDRLRSYAVARSLFEPLELFDAIKRLGFVQADPIRSPARAQDLILRHRALSYRVGELEARFESKRLIEDYVHVYGFLPRQALEFLHPRNARRHLDKKNFLLTQRMLQLVQERGSLHPRQAQEALGSAVRRNAWGGQSSATTQLLERLHFEGNLVVARRLNGIRVYSLAPEHERALSLQERVLAAGLLLLRLYAPIPKKSFLQVLRMTRWSVDAGIDSLGVLRLLEKQGGVRIGVINGIEFYWPDNETLDMPTPDKVRFLAPFDPIVWDRARFEIFWKWKYRFEAYTPASQRKMGYYAMPLLWRDQVIGWVNVNFKNQEWNFETGFVVSAPKDKKFKNEFDAEVERFKEFMRPFQHA